MRCKWILLTAALTAALGAAPAAARGNPTIVIKTNHGTMEAVLYKDKAPNTVKNILAYVKAKFYDGTVFHRVIPDFMVQGGGFDKQMNKKPTRAAIKNEADNGLLNEHGTLAMARTAARDSATSQFFINLKHNNFLDHGFRDFGYAVFGKLTKGQGVLDEIAGVATGTCATPSGQGLPNCPREQVVIESIRVKGKK